MPRDPSGIRIDGVQLHRAFTELQAACAKRQITTSMVVVYVHGTPSRLHVVPKDYAAARAGAPWDIPL